MSEGRPDQGVDGSPWVPPASDSPSGSPPPGGYPPPPGGYPPGGYWLPPPYASQPGPSGFAIASLVLGVVSFAFCGIPSVLAVVFGHIALARTRRPVAPEGGRGLAIAGLVLGYVGIGLLVAFIGIGVAVDSDDDESPDVGKDRPVTEQPSTTSTTSTGDVAGTKPHVDPPPAQMVRGYVFTETVFEGDGKPAEIGDVLTVHYVGVLVDGTEFDASWDRGQPLTFTLGQGEVIDGWDDGLVGAREGERRRLVVGSDRAYGATGAPPEIPPDAPLAFTVDVLRIQPAEGDR